MLLLQKLPTDTWGDRDIDLVVAEAFRLKFTFHGAQKHIPDASQWSSHSNNACIILVYRILCYSMALHVESIKLMIPWIMCVSVEAI